MNKNEFLNQLFACLNGVSDAEKDQISQYYSEILLDKIEEGFSEEEAVSAFGKPKEAAERIQEDILESRVELQRISNKVIEAQPTCNVLVNEPGITSFDID